MDPKTPKIDPQEKTLYSTVFERKEMGKGVKREEECEGKNMDKSGVAKGPPLGQFKQYSSGVFTDTAPKKKDKPKEEAPGRGMIKLDTAPPKEKDLQRSVDLVGKMISKADAAAKAALGSFKIGQSGPVQEGTKKPMGQVLEESTKKRDASGQSLPPPPPAAAMKAVVPGPGMGGGVVNPSSSKMGGGVKSCGEMTEKALSASSIPRLPRAMLMALQEDPMRSGSMVLTSPARAPLHGQLVEELSEDADRRGKERLERSYGVYKSCSGCGRRYLAKSADAECPTCSVNKSMSCFRCGRLMIKSHGGGPATCPICS